MVSIKSAIFGGLRRKVLKLCGFTMKNCLILCKIHSIIPVSYTHLDVYKRKGVGTLLFIFITKGKAPAYLGSSFAFLSPALLVISKYGYEYALGGFVVLGIAGMCVALIVRQCGTDWIDIVLPTAAMGPVVALIGLELAGNAASTAGLLDEKVDPKNVIVFLVTLGVAVFGQILFRGFLSVIPILIAIIAGYVACLLYTSRCV